MERAINVDRASVMVTWNQLGQSLSELQILEVLLDNNDTHLAFLDPFFNFVKVNFAYVKDSGYCKEELIGRNHFELFPNREIQEIFEKVRTTLEGISYSAGCFGYPGQTREGVTYWDWSLTPMVNKGNILIGFVLSLNEVTEKVLLRHQLEKARSELDEVRSQLFNLTKQRGLAEDTLKIQKMESISLLAGGIAHDFNNYLTAILSNLQLSQLKYEKGDAIGCYLNNIEKIILEAASLTKQLLTLSKGGAPVKQSTSLKDLLSDTAEFVLHGSGSKCIYEIPDALWPVEADTGQLSQVISNIIINADQAMNGGGLITITAMNTMIQSGENLALKPGRYVKITIADQGTGILPEHLPKIFDPYFTTKPNGSGLGLATSFFIIANHNGYIDVESQVGVGTSFHIYLPVSEFLPTEGMEFRKDLQHGKGKILLMDDEAIILESAGEMLREIGYTVELASDGAETIAKYVTAKQNGAPFDIVILDLTIPAGLGAKETIGELRKYDPKVRAVISSGYSSHPLLDDYQLHGFAGVVPKPYQLSELNKLIQRLLTD